MSLHDPAAASLGAASKDIPATAAAPVVVSGLARIVPVFSIAFALVYFYGVWTNGGVIRFYANVNQLHFSPQPAELGPAMYWYGWLVNGFIGGVVASAAATLAPRDWFERYWGRLAWGALAVSVGLILALFVLLREYFTR